MQKPSWLFTGDVLVLSVPEGAVHRRVGRQRREAAVDLLALLRG